MDEISQLRSRVNRQIAEQVMLGIMRMMTDMDGAEPWIEECKKTGDHETLLKRLGIELPDDNSMNAVFAHDKKISVSMGVDVSVNKGVGHAVIKKST